MVQQLFEQDRDYQQLSFYRSKRPEDHDVIVTKPVLGGAIASAFEQLARYADPVVEIARMGIHEIHDVCWGIDLSRDSADLRANVLSWTREASVAVLHMAGGRV